MFNKYMPLAIAEARISLQQGNNGFGAVIVKGGQLVSAAHDTEVTKNDPTSHAEINAIRKASMKLGRSLAGCILVSTHEPCPMCATAVVWSGIAEIAYGYSIREAIAQGRKRIDLPCAEIFRRAGAPIKIHEDVLNAECSVLYRSDVRAEIEKLRGADDGTLSRLNADSTGKRARWFEENRDGFRFIDGDPLASGYRLLLARLKITEDGAPVVKRTEREIVFHSRNFCPTLEACKILGLDTRSVCRKLNEGATDALVKQVDPRLRFSRNYEKLRPYAEYCEERISLDQQTQGPRKQA